MFSLLLKDLISDFYLTSIQWIQRVSYVLWLLKLDNILFQNAQSLNAKEFLDKLRNNPVLIGKVKDSIQTPELLTQLVLDASTVLNPWDIHAEILDILELQTREYVYKIHQRRIAKLKRISQFE